MAKSSEKLPTYEISSYYLHIKKLRLNTEKREVVIFKKRKVGDDEKYTFKFNNKNYL